MRNGAPGGFVYDDCAGSGKDENERPNEFRREFSFATSKAMFFAK